MIVIIDNYDSFTYNLVQYIGEVTGGSRKISVYRNDQISVQQIRLLSPTQIIISPGPCTPDQAGISVEAAHLLGPSTPILGVCLGHQAIAQAFGARIVRASQAVHGKTSEIEHSGAGIFSAVPQRFLATRYHSLVVAPDSLPPCLEVLAWSKPKLSNPGEQREIMAVAHKAFPHIIGLQFHPESILTTVGKQLLAAFLSIESDKRLYGNAR